MRGVRHRFACPLRWADLDLLGHVNNVRYVDYLREGRDDLFRAAGVDLGSAGAVVRRHELTFLAPLMFGTEPVCVDCWVCTADPDGVTIESVVHDGRGRTDGSRADVPYLRARTVVTARADGGGSRRFTDTELAALARYVEPPEDRAEEPRPVSARPDPERGYALHVRASDLDVGGTASDVSLVEYFQESRVAFFQHLLHELPDTGKLRWVIAQTDIEHLRPIRRGAAYHCSSRLARVGSKSLTVESVIRAEDGTEHATARVVLVVFDPSTQRATEPPPGYREVLEGLVEPA